MESLNDLIWTDEEVLENEPETRGVMMKPCSISIPSCDGESSGGTPYVAGGYGGFINCGC